MEGRFFSLEPHLVENLFGPLGFCRSTTFDGADHYQIGFLEEALVGPVLHFAGETKGEGEEKREEDGDQ